MAQLRQRRPLGRRRHHSHPSSLFDLLSGVRPSSGIPYAVLFHFCFVDLMAGLFLLIGCGLAVSARQRGTNIDRRILSFAAIAGVSIRKTLQADDFPMTKRSEEHTSE